MIDVVKPSRRGFFGLLAAVPFLGSFFAPKAAEGFVAERYMDIRWFASHEMAHREWHGVVCYRFNGGSWEIAKGKLPLSLGRKVTFELIDGDFPRFVFSE